MSWSVCTLSFGGKFEWRWDGIFEPRLFVLDCQFCSHLLQLWHWNGSSFVIPTLVSSGRCRSLVRSDLQCAHFQNLTPRIGVSDGPLYNTCAWRAQASLYSSFWYWNDFFGHVPCLNDSITSVFFAAQQHSLQMCLELSRYGYFVFFYFVEFRTGSRGP